ncbi:type II secretion system F family protein [Sulfurospirillum sp. 1612]|uniref:type II secretion system F family protein n=1 Tax=Sulfurospirillum sp. 1612 TaxID=3094835 RepID=UPI002F95702B
MKYFEIEFIKEAKREKLLMTAANKIEAIDDFKRKSLGVFVMIKEVKEPLSLKFSKLFEKVKAKLRANKIPLEPYIASLRHIATMLNAGLSITVCLEDVIKTTEHKRLKEIYNTMLQEVESGINLSDTFQEFEYELGAISVALIDLGEKTGTLDESIEKLADILQEVQDNRMKLKKATRYPIIVIIAMLIAFSLVITMVIPQFQSMFTEYNAHLPFPTLLLLWIENAIKIYGLYVLIGAAIFSIGLSVFYKKSELFRHLFDRYMLKVYIVGQVIYLSMIGRFVYVFDRLSTSGIPIIDSLKTAIGIVENAYLKERLNDIIKAIEEGKSLKDGFENTGQFDSMVIQMISAGESSGALSKMLEKISDIFRKRYSYLVDNVATMIEPLLIAGIAGFVLLLALGIFLPMWSIAEAVGGT